MNASNTFRLPRVTSSSDERVQQLLVETEHQLGRVPNLYRAMANSSAALGGYLAFRSSLTHGVLDAKAREHIALLVAQLNDCTYCVSAHGLRLSKMGTSEEEILEVRRGQSSDPTSHAILQLASKVLTLRGDLTDADLQNARAAGLTDAHIAEVVANVALNVFSNFFNHLARPELDFPLREARDV